MSRDELIAHAREHLEYARSGTIPLVDDVVEIPAGNYHERERWEAEMAAIFARVPLVLGFTCELSDPGDYKAMDAGSVPILLVRGADGVMRGFINMCSHRGAQLVEVGSGNTRRFTCPYHAWVYDGEGALVGIRDRHEFGEIDTSCHGLTEIPVAERAGIIWGSTTPGTDLHLDAFLAGYDDLLAEHQFENCRLVGRQAIPGPNWKVAYDGYLDFYHLPILHKNSFGPDYNSQAIYSNWGPHQRVQAPDHRLLALEELPEDEWPMRVLLSGVWTIFPHVSIASFDAGGHLYMISQLFPGADPDTSLTFQNFLATFDPDEEQQDLIKKQMAFLDHVVRDEDYYTGNLIQQAVKTGAKSHFLFGRNEEGGQRFHRWTDALLAADSDDKLQALYADGVG